MARLRRALGPMVAGWLFCQVATVITVPVAFWVGSAEGVLECTCIHGDHATCPMHHEPAPDTKLCLMQSANDDGAVFSSLLGTVGLVPVRTHAVVPPSEHSVVLTPITTTSLRPVTPDPRPPRA